MTPDRYHDKCTECQLRAALAPRIVSTERRGARSADLGGAASPRLDLAG
jgi:hypothetical protein